MNRSARYLLDSSVLIQAARQYYAFDIAPGFWAELASKCAAGTLVSIDRVEQELQKGKDDLAAWAAKHISSAFLKTGDNDVLSVYRDLMTWAFSAPHYTQGARDEFARLDNADPWLVAYSKAHNMILVTQEASAPRAQKVIKIPEVCKAFGVRCCSTFEMLRGLGITL